MGETWIPSPGDARMFDVLLFDLGGVLIDFAGFEELRRLLPGEPSVSDIRRRWIHSEPVHLFESGDMEAREFAARFVLEWELDLSPSAFLREFSTWARGPYPGAIPLLRRLRSSHRLACLSNSNELHTHLHRRSLEPYLDRFYFSNELGMAKPDSEIYLHAIRDLAVPPGRIAFFDDTPVNIEAAGRVGMRARRVDGVAELARALKLLAL